MTEEQQKAKELARHQELNDLIVVMKLKEGRRFIWRFLEGAGIFRNCFDGTPKTYYNEGRREYALRYFNDVLEAAPDQYLLMCRENKPMAPIEETEENS